MMKTKKCISCTSFLTLLVLSLWSPILYAQTTLRDRIRERIREKWLQNKEQTSGDFGTDDYHFSSEQGGITRKYNVHLPPAYNKDVLTPIVIYFHGGGGSSKAAYQDGMDKAADKFVFILVIPAGTGPIPDRLLTWNAGKWDGGNCCGYAINNNIDDVVLISKIIDEAKNKFNVDANRIYATGISNGAMMSYRLACELSNKIA